MLRFPTLILISLSAAMASAGELRVSAKEPLVVSAPEKWQVLKDKAPAPAFPFDTYRVEPPGTRNAVALITVFDQDKPEFTDPAFLKKILQGDCQPYVSKPADLAKLQFKEVKLTGGLGFYANFTDPDLVGKPVQKGTYKTVTPILLCLGKKYLMKVTLLCDDLNGVDYRELMKVVESLQIKRS